MLAANKDLLVQDFKNVVLVHRVVHPCNIM